MTKLRRAKMKGSVVSSSNLETDSGSEYYKKRMEGQSDDEARETRVDRAKKENIKNQVKNIRNQEDNVSRSTEFHRGTKVYVYGDASVGMPDWKGKVVKDNGDFIVVKDKAGEEEVPRRFVEKQ